MIKRKALDGKPYAENPHVRIDEGDVASATPKQGSLLNVMTTFISIGKPFVIALRTWLDYGKTIASGPRQIYGKMCMSVLIVATLSAHISIGDGYRWVNLGRNDTSQTFRIAYQELNNTDLLEEETAYENYVPKKYDVTINGFATDTGIERGNVIVTNYNIVIPAQLTYEVHKLSGDGRGETGAELHTGWVRRLQNACFRGSKKLLSVSIPSSIRCYGGFEFAECTALHSVTVGCHNISRSMFYGCTSLKHIDLAYGSVENISESAFRSSGLLDISIPSSVANIGDSAFYQCSGMTSVVINAGVQSIGAQAFRYCSALKSVELPRNVKVGKKAFEGCTGMTNLIMQSGIHVESDAFRSCSGLKTIVVNNQGEAVGSTFFNGQSFAYCNGLESIRFEGNAPTIDGSVLGYVPSSCTVYVHRDSTGWGVDIPGTWKGLRIEYIESDSGSGSGGETPPVSGRYDLGFYKGWTGSKEWGDSMFVTTTRGGTTPMTSIAQGDKIYLYYGFTNLAGDFDMSGFVNRFTLSTGTTFEDDWSNDTLAAGLWGWVGESYSPAALQNLAPGTYTLTCTLDATSKLSETNEGNNTKSITFTIVASGSSGGTQPSDGKYDLGFSIGSINTKAWSDSMFVTTKQGGTEPMTSIKQGSKIYLYYAYKNLAGDFDVSSFVNRFTLNTGATFDRVKSSLSAGSWGWSGESWSPSALQNLAPGTYTLTCKLDATDQVTETNEDNNTKSITFSIVASGSDSSSGSAPASDSVSDPASDSDSSGGSETSTYASPVEIVKPWTATKAVILNGAMYDSDGNVAGVVQLKVAKPNVRKGTAKVSGYVMPIDGKKAMLTTSTANVSATAPMNVTATARSLGALTVKIGDDGFSGRVGNYTIFTANVGGNWTRTNAKVHVAASSLPDGTLKALLPNGEPVLAKSGKWAFNKGTSIKLSKDKTKAEWDTSGGKSNLSSMKLTYTPKTGLFKGSFKVYALESAASGKKKLKKYTANVTGVVVDGKGYGLATIKLPVASPWAVTVE